MDGGTVRYMSRGGYRVCVYARAPARCSNGTKCERGPYWAFARVVRWRAGRGANFAPINALRAQTHPPSLPNRTQSWPTVAPRAADARPAHVSQPLGNHTPRRALRTLVHPLRPSPTAPPAQWKGVARPVDRVIKSAAAELDWQKKNSRVRFY